MTLQFDQDWKTTQQYHRRSGCFMESASDSLSSLINSINLFVVKSLEREPARVSSIKRCSGLHWNDCLTISELERVLRFYKKMSYWLYFVIPEKRSKKRWATWYTCNVLYQQDKWAKIHFWYINLRSRRIKIIYSWLWLDLH